MSERPLRTYLSQSMLQSYERCPRKYYYQYIMKYYGESTYSAPLDFGSTIHDIIEKAIDVPEDDRVDAIQSMIYEKVLEVEEDSKKDYEGRLLKLVDPLADIVDSYTITNAEIYVSDKLFNPEELSVETTQMLLNVLERRGKDMDLPFEGVWFGGFIDAVVESEDREDYEDIIDWKTGRFSRNWIHVYERQIQLYTHVMRLNGRKIESAKIVYVEQKGKEHLVDVAIPTCERIYNSMKETFRTILSLGESIENFNTINNVAECNGCYFDFICNA